MRVSLETAVEISAVEVFEETFFKTFLKTPNSKSVTDKCGMAVLPAEMEVHST
ncbi:hypothetical protein [Paenibacillus sp.]|jgi:hypothetical protein|uniref:hypothetical protein n=1 Tax=Paenibacillus sp. TaxID=58172 RepID=UPI00282523B2|nr:hypothetical protein [Paenibacillus sp.]MDR0266939.1 hypothetical protein [Paenibacillus sp.]